MECLSHIGGFLTGIGTLGLCSIAWYTACSWKKQLIPDAKKEAIRYIAHLNTDLKLLNEYSSQTHQTFNMPQNLIDPKLLQLNEKVVEGLALVKSSVLHIISLEDEASELSNLLNKLMSLEKGCTQYLYTTKTLCLLKLNEELLAELMKIKNLKE